MSEVPIQPESHHRTKSSVREMAVKDGIARDINKAEATERFGLGKNAYARYNKQIEERTCVPKPKSGRKRKLNKADLEILMDINEAHRGALTFEEVVKYVKWY